MTIKKKVRTDKPILVKVGKAYIDPTQIREIRPVKNGTLYIIKFKDDNTNIFPCWAQPKDVEILLEYFSVLEG